MRTFLVTIVCLAGMVLLGTPMTGIAVPPGSRPTSSAATLQAQLKDVDAKITTARAQQARLQSQVTQLEQQNAARKQQLQQRDAEIAALQQKLAAVGVPAASASVGH